MRRWLELGTMAGVAVVALSCGPGPVPLQGTLSYSEDCPLDTTGVHPSCPGSAEYFTGLPQTGTPPLIVRCIVQPAGGGYPARVQFTLGRAISGSTPDDGMSICGDVAAPGPVTNAAVHLYASGSDSVGTGSQCQIELTSLTATDFAGKVKCTGLADSVTPSHLRSVTGTGSGGDNPTMDPAWGDFSLLSCDTTSYITSCH